MHVNSRFRRLALTAVAAGLLCRLVPAAELRAITVSSTDTATALELELSSPVTPQDFTLQQPLRLVIDLPSTRRSAQLKLPAAAPPIKALRLAPRGKGNLRLVVELAAGTRSAVTATAAGSAGASLVRVSLGGAGAVAAAALISKPTDSAAPAPAPAAVRAAHAPATTDRDVIIAVDAGHGGEDPGASGRSGTQEKHVTLAIARALAERINREPGMRAVLTRNSDVFVPLRDRMGRARASRADLFVSIHADAVRNRDVEGASVYVLSDRGASSEAARFLADRENAADLKGVSLGGANESLASVLIDLSQSASIGNSVEAADKVLSALDGVGAVRKRQVQHAGFVVLKSPDIPSMLIETAYISNPAEERKLRSADYQRQLAQAIHSGVVQYFRTHPPDGTLYARQRRESGGGTAALARSGP